MKKIIFVALGTGIFFAGCSSKYQANELPQPVKKVRFVDNDGPTRYYLNLEERTEFEKYVAKELEGNFDADEAHYDATGLKSEQLKTRTYKDGDLWSRGYEMDRKRY